MENNILTTDRTKWTALTPERRKAIYGVVAALLAVGIAYGVVAPEQSAQWLDVLDKVLGLLALVLAAVHTGGVYTAPSYGTPDAE
nr:MAG TPA: Mycobacterial 2 TMS Phage Holin (M2 Hol) Family [Caudoviricetes sp.]